VRRKVRGSSAMVGLVTSDERGVGEDMVGSRWGTMDYDAALGLDLGYLARRYGGIGLGEALGLCALVIVGAPVLIGVAVV